MKLATMMVALVAAVASLAVGNAFMMPPAVPAGLARNAGLPSSQPAPSRSAGARRDERDGVRYSHAMEGWEKGKARAVVWCGSCFAGLLHTC